MPWSLVSYEINSRQCMLLSMSGWCCLREKSDFLCQTPTFPPYTSRFCDRHKYPRVLSISQWATRLLSIFYALSLSFMNFQVFVGSFLLFYHTCLPRAAPYVPTTSAFLTLENSPMSVQNTVKIAIVTLSLLFFVVESEYC